jgi:hypothetical protein
VFEFSCLSAPMPKLIPAFKTAFRSQMAERVMRQSEAKRSKPVVASVSSVQLRTVALSRVLLRPALQATSTVVTRPASSLQNNDCNGAWQSRSSFPRPFAFSSESPRETPRETPRSVLSKLMPKVKRAASANLFLRLSERLAHLQHREVSVRQSSGVQSSVTQSSVTQSSVTQSSVTQSSVTQSSVRLVPVRSSVASPSSVLRPRSVASRLM